MSFSHAIYTDSDLANVLAVGAGKLLLTATEPQLIEGKALGDLGDSIAQQWLAMALQAHRPEDAVLSEEAEDNLARLHADRVWIIDPLDGTKEYMRNSSDWGVHIALWRAKKPLLGSVYLPATQQLFSSETVKKNSHPPTGIAVLSTFHRGGKCQELAQAAGLQPSFRGSAGLKAMLVVVGKADAYLHAGGQYAWDSCAPVAIAQAAGLHCSRLDGSPLLYNQADNYLPDLLICRPELASRIISLVREYRSA